LQTFRDKAKNAIGSNQIEIRRGQDWLESQLQFWKGEIRRAEEAVFVAKNELARRKMMRISDRPPDTTDQEKALRKAKARLEHAEEKRDNTKAWLLKYPDAVLEYEGQAKPFQDMLEFEMSRMIAFLEQKRAALDAYLHTNPAAGGSAMSLSTGRYQLANAYKSLKQEWDATENFWRDVVRQDFTEQRWDPLSERVASVLTAMDKLDQALAQMRQDCG